MNKKKKIKILIADDHSITRQGLKTALSVYDDLEVAGEAANGKEAVEICRKTGPDVILMDLEMPVLGGIEATGTIRDRYPDIRVIALTSFSGKKMIKGALRAGAISYIQKNILADELAQVIRDAYRGKSNLSSEAADAVIHEIAKKPEDGYGLSAREIEVLSLAARGLSNKEIASRLSLSVHTVKFHMRNIMSKLGAHTRSEAAVKAVKEGLLDQQ